MLESQKSLMKGEINEHNQDRRNLNSKEYRYGRKCKA